MKCLLIICQCVFWFQWMSTTQFCAAENSKPNVVLIMGDDMGYGDPVWYNRSSKIPTPLFDSL
ncbi:MAG: Cerebroside-sulfatase, partial [Rubripirellula sp.]